jgi:glycosyltransferase involved in cell wall biosynthesis
LFKRVDRFLYIGTANRRLYQKFGVPEERLYSAPYAVDNERFGRQVDALRGQRPEIRRQWGIPEDAYVILFCGKFIPKKRPFDLIEAAQLLLKLHPELKPHLLFAGSGELGAEMRARCEVVVDAESPNKTYNKEQITDNEKPRASFAGFLNQTEISKAYVAADILVLPSDYGETWGLVVNEANASDLGATVSDHCGCAEDLGNAPSNRVFKCGDVKDLASKLQQTSNVSSIESSTSIKQHNIGDTVAAISKAWSQLS